MIETSANPRIARAYRDAHAARGAAVAAMAGHLIAAFRFPLGRPVLTGLFRWA